MTEAAETPPPARISLREQLGGTPDPDFTLMLPPGWVRREVTDDEQERMLTKVRGRLLEAHRPDLYGRMRQLVTEAFTQMRKVSTVAMFTAGDSAPDSAYMPASLTATIQQADPGENLDAYVRAAIASDGATPLLGDKRIMRVERESSQTLDGEPMLVTTVVYMSPVPGSERRRALLLTLVIMRPPEAPADDAPLLQMKALFDLCVSTLTWIPRG
ncbi:MAG: hypothetical protein J7484_01755 [Microbacterium sp.]|nr:hypothetical protein [Microbacterium sp.]